MQFLLAIYKTAIVKFIELGECDEPGIPSYHVRKQLPFRRKLYSNGILKV
jgi:hypothetical protein